MQEKGEHCGGSYEGILEIQSAIETLNITKRTVETTYEEVATDY